MQFGLASWADAPKRPAGHGKHAPAPAIAYRPATHSTAVAAVEPGGHANPAAHGPSHPGWTRLVLDP